MKHPFMIGISTLILGMGFWSCSSVHQSPAAGWMAQPAYQEVDALQFAVRIEPRKSKYAYYDFFLLTLINKSDADLVIDWNASRYLHKGNPQGVLVFEGIDPAAVKTATVPLEKVAPGTIFSREIMPMRLIAWAPVKAQTASGRSILPGMLPVGENGILLSIQHADGRAVLPLTVTISTTVSP
jgi:hypothetical protein